MREKDLSIIIPVYNVDKYLSQCLQNIIVNQVEISYEIILVDDGSTDQSGIICDEYQKRYKQIKVFHNKNMGLSSARNYGLKKAEGRWISFIDSDDIVPPYYLHSISKLILQNQSIDIFLFRFEQFYQENDLIINKAKEITQVPIDKSEAMYLLTTENWGNYVWNKLYRKSTFTNIQFPAFKDYEDIATVYKVFDQAETFARVNLPLYYYRQHLGSLVHPKTIDEYITAFSDSLDARDEQIDFFANNGFIKAKDSAINHRSYVCMDYVAYLINNKVKKRKLIDIAIDLASEYKISASKNKLKDFIKINIFKISPYFYAMLKKYFNNKQF